MAVSLGIDRLQESLRRLQASGDILHFVVNQSMCDLSWRLAATLFNGEHITFELTESELRMEGERAVAHWAATIETDLSIRARAARDNQRAQQQAQINSYMQSLSSVTGLYESGPNAANAQQQYNNDHVNNWANANQSAYSYLQYNPGTSPPQRIEALYGWQFIQPTWFGADFATDPKADQRAKELFKMVAGEAAFKRLEANKPLNLTGSLRTQYTLHNRSTYCIERTKDGAKLCAVVPNVPLFDHLLGIKLMVEHDEPEFLKIANVSGGSSNSIHGVSIVDAVIRSFAL